jgi:hypothetical protein
MGNQHLQLPRRASLIKEYEERQGRAPPFLESPRLYRGLELW